MTEQTDDGARRAYWTEQMDRGYDLVDQLLTFLVDECYESFAPIPDDQLQPLHPLEGIEQEIDAAMKRR